MRPLENLLLAALPAADRRSLLQYSERVKLVSGQTLTEPGERIQHVLFPIHGFISLITPMNRRSQLEVALVGYEGMFGVSLILGVDIAPLRALVQGAGEAWRMDAATFCKQLERRVELQRELKRYLYVQLREFADNAACTRFHLIEGRLARWLLMTRDRAQSDSFHMTHEFLAYMLGVRRAGVTRAAVSLQRRRLLRYRRGNVEILDPIGLQAASCSCYATHQEAYAQVLGAKRSRTTRCAVTAH